MKNCVLASLIFAALWSLPAAAQAPAAKTATSSVKPNWTPPKTAWGDPDLQGEWPATARIPMQRPADLGERAVLTDAELAQREIQAKKQAAEDGEEVAKGSDVTINPPSYWVERGKPDRQASLVVDPPNGRIPPLTPAGQAAMKAQRGGLGPGSHFPDKVDSWEDFDIYSRCITRGMVSSMLPTLYNFGNEIIQAPGVVLIRNEMIHETRVIPLDGRPHVGKGISTYMGDSRGHWEGSTLVVDTTNFTDLNPYVDAENLHVVERLTRVDADTVLYRFTVDDAGMWTKPWSGELPMTRLQGQIYEYACHEANYGLANTLSGARAAEAEAAKKSAAERK